MKKVIKLKDAMVLEQQLQSFLTEKIVMVSKIRARKTSKSFKGDLDIYVEQRNASLKELGELHSERGSNGEELYTIKEENKEE